MSDLVSKCVLRVEVNPQETDVEETASKPTKPLKGRRKSSEISVETFPSRLEEPRDWGLLPECSRDGAPSNLQQKNEDKTEIGFFSGNPFVEITKGILHLYKEDVLSERKEALSLCLLGVPTSMTCHDLLAFTAPCHADISHIRVLRDSMPNQYMALLTFRNHESAREFYETYNGEPYSSLETDLLCRIVWVSRVEWAHDGLPPPGHTELPICPVCLERMDESVDGVLTIQCNHAFHAQCLEQWSDSTCPVCRCVQSPEQSATNECEQCSVTYTTTNATSNPVIKQTPDALWICLICGHVGCGRYQNGHAALHYRSTGHCYALQLGSHRVWDYKGDNFVHRLLQNKADGKLVASNAPSSGESNHDEKVDSVQLEFTYLLTSQLDEQRLYFEEKLAMLDSLNNEEIQLLNNEIVDLKSDKDDLKKKLNYTIKEKQQIEKKLLQQNAKLSSCLSELNEEKQLGKALRSNQQQWQMKLTKLETDYNELKMKKEREICELQEQVRDLMIFIDAKQTIEHSENRDEIASGTVFLGDNQKANKKGKKKR